MPYPVVDQTTPMETIIALAQMGAPLKFRCLSCGKVHRLDSKAWERCSENYNYELHTTIPGVVARVYIANNKPRGTSISLPTLTFQLPQIYAHKLALYDEEQAAMLLAEYMQICHDIEYTSSPQLVVSNDVFLPLHIIVGWEKIRQFAYDYGILPDNSLFQKYRQALFSIVERCAAFARDHIDLFTPYMSIPIKVIKDKSTDQLWGLRGDGRVIDFKKLYDTSLGIYRARVQDRSSSKYFLNKAIHTTINFTAVYKQPSVVIIEDLSYIMVDDSSYVNKSFDFSPPSLKCNLKVSQAMLSTDPINPINCQDPITACALKTMDELQALFANTLKAISTAH